MVHRHLNHEPHETAVLDGDQLRGVNLGSKAKMAKTPLTLWGRGSSGPTHPPPKGSDLLNNPCMGPPSQQQSVNFEPPPPGAGRYLRKNCQQDVWKESKTCGQKIGISFHEPAGQNITRSNLPYIIPGKEMQALYGMKGRDWRAPGPGLLPLVS